MTKTDFDIFVYRLKHEVGMTNPQRSQRYKDFITNRVQDPHHLMGSLGYLKSSDYCCIPLSHEEHMRIQNERVTPEQMIAIVRWNWKYIEHLEEELKKRNGR
jgi:hypothetical protein